MHRHTTFYSYGALHTCKVVNVLQILQNAGALETNDTERQTRGILQAAGKDHSTATTAYGPVVQQMQILGIGKWEYCHPQAYLRYMSSLSDSYAEVFMHSECRTQKMSIVLYLDEIVPGNPFRPDKAWKLWSVYWCCLEWPAWILSRSGFWAALGVIRSQVLDDCPGGISLFWKHIVALFRDPGITLQLVYKESRIPCTLKYIGTLADEAALKAINSFKGASGIKCCMDSSLTYCN